ncbi:MAG: hypothetical protein K2K83_00680 [Rikenella sp.]|nr:hypothetical protein [Rikenella sp.]
MQRLFSRTLVPAPGYRHSGFGTLYGVGEHGFIWASSFTDTYTYRLHFLAGALYPNDYGHCANGFQLRCLQE